jgi:hypothetical protein
MASREPIKLIGIDLLSFVRFLDGCNAFNFQVSACDVLKELGDLPDTAVELHH